MRKERTEEYIHGFCKAAESYGIGPKKLVKAASSAVLEKRADSWNVLVHDINHDRIEEYDVVPAFDAWLDDLRPKDRPKTREAFDEELEHCARYRFWAKCEYEVLVGGLFSKTGPEKTDVYRQLKLNWGPFCSFMWERRQRKQRKQ